MYNFCFRESSLHLFIGFVAFDRVKRCRLSLNTIIFPENTKWAISSAAVMSFNLNEPKTCPFCLDLRPLFAVDNFVYPSFSDTNEESSGLHNSLTRKAAKRALWIL